MNRIDSTEGFASLFFSKSDHKKLTGCGGRKGELRRQWQKGLKVMQEKQLKHGLLRHPW